MKLSQILSLATTAIGTIASVGVLQRRHRWEMNNRRVAICVDYDDIDTAAIRAGIAFDDLIVRLVNNGATHISLPERTIGRMMAQGILTPQAPATPCTDAPQVGHWNYLYGGSAEFVARTVDDINYRLPHLTARVVDETTIAFGGSIPAVANLPLSFDEAHARHIQSLGLAVVPRPISYDWPDPGLIDHTLHSAGHVADLVAFDGDWVLGHEMQINDTLRHMGNYGLSMVYFAETRHQRGDWFIAKGRLPNVVLGHRFTSDEMMGMDYHSAAHQWVHFADERGVRFCYLNFFRLLHATEPLEGLHYVHFLKHALEDAGYTVTKDILSAQKAALDVNSAELALAGVMAAGIGSAAISQSLNLPEQLAVPLVTLASMGAAALPYVEASGALTPKPHSHGDGDHGHHHGHDGVEHVHAHGGGGHSHSHGDQDAAPMATSFAPKLIGLAVTSLAPVAALTSAQEGSLFAWLSANAYNEAGAIALATATTGVPYQLAVEEYRGFGLDFLVPLVGAALQVESGKLRTALLASVVGAWVYSLRDNNGDLIGKIDAPPAEAHVHHVSLANRIFGDLAIQLGPRPARKWAGLAPLGLALASGEGVTADFGRVVGTLGAVLGLSSYRQPVRGLVRTTEGTLPSYGGGAGLGLLVKLLGG
ncbi:MAG: DUF5693 family protein [Candidatus Promineifilaceae bacterium]